MKKLAVIALLLTSALSADFPQTPVTPYGTQLATAASDQKVDGAKVVYEYVVAHHLGFYYTPNGKLLVFQPDTPPNVVATAAVNLRSQPNAGIGSPGYSLSSDNSQIVGRDQVGIGQITILAIDSQGRPDTQTTQILLGKLQANAQY